MADTATTRAWLAPHPGYRRGDSGPHWHGRVALYGFKYDIRATHLPTGAIEVELEVLRPPRRGLVRHFRGIAVGSEQRHYWNGVVAMKGSAWTVDAARCVPPLLEMPEPSVRARYAIMRVDLSPTSPEPETEGPSVDWLAALDTGEE